MSISSSAPVPNDISTIENDEPLKLRSRNSPSGSIGCSARRSQSTNAPRASTASTAATSTRGEVQPAPGAEMTTKTRALMPTVDSSTPTGSSFRAGPRVSGISSTAATTATIVIGTLSRKIEPHQ